MNLTIARLALRALVGQRRGLVLLALPLLLVALAGALRALTGQSIDPGLVLVQVGLALVVPILSLLAANGVLGPEIDDGSVVYLLATPVSRYVVGLSKFVVAAGVAVSLSVLGLVGAGLAGGVEGRWLLGAGVTGGVAALLYTGVFTALSAATRHGMIAGLLYALVLEALLGRFLSGVRYVSISAISQRMGEAVADVDLPVGELSLGYAVTAALVVLVVGPLVAGWRLRRFQLRGDE